MNIDLTGKTALICGSTQGIGWAAAQELAKLGARCVLMARNYEKLKANIDTLNASYSNKHDVIIADFSDPENVRTAINDYVKINAIDILVNNSGGPASGKITEATTQAFLDAFNQHLICNHIITLAVIEHMKKSGYGRIINVISTSVKIPLSGLGVSNTTRGAVASWAKTMANELAVYGITVNNVLPGATKTVRLSSIIENKAKKRATEIVAVEQAMLNEIPMKRFGKPEEIADMIAFLATPAAAYVTGQSICVDGGRTGSI